MTSRVTNMGVTLYKLKPATPQQISLFDGTRMDTKSLARASDKINDRYGEFTLVPATMANMQDIILKRVAFGNVQGAHKPLGN
jgi:DNA polymerase-4